MSSTADMIHPLDQELDLDAAIRARELEKYKRPQKKFSLPPELKPLSGWRPGSETYEQYQKRQATATALKPAKKRRR